MHKDFTTGVTLYEWCDMTDNLKLVIFKKESNGRSDLEGNILLHSYKLSLKQHKHPLKPMISLLNLPAIFTTFSTES